MAQRIDPNRTYMPCDAAEMLGISRQALHRALHRGKGNGALKGLLGSQLKDFLLAREGRMRRGAAARQLAAERAVASQQRTELLDTMDAPRTSPAQWRVTVRLGELSRITDGDDALLVMRAAMRDWATVSQERPEFWSASVPGTGSVRVSLFRNQPWPGRSDIYAARLLRQAAVDQAER